MNDLTVELENEKLSALLEKTASRITELRLDAVALFFLEAQLPLTTVLHTSTLFLSPIAGPLFGTERIHDLQIVLSDRSNITRLMNLIEARSSNLKKTDLDAREINKT